MKMLALVFIFWTLSLHSVVLIAQEEPILVINPHGHSAMVRDIMFTPDGSTLISISDDKTIRLWDIETGNLIKTIRGQIGDGEKGKLYAGALSPDGNILVVGGCLNDNEIRLINIEKSEQIGLLRGHTDVIHALAFSQNGQFLASGGYDNTVRIWDVSRRRLITTLYGHSDHVFDVAFSPDGRKVVSASFDSTLRLWDISAIGTRNFSPTSVEMSEHTGEVSNLTYSPNGRYIVSVGLDGKIMLWDNNGKFIDLVDEYSGEIWTVSFSLDSEKIVVCGAGNCNAIVYSIPSSDRISTFTKHTNTVVASAFNGDNVIATAGGNAREIYIWNANTGELKTNIVGKGRQVWSVAFGEGLNVAFGNSCDRVDDSNWGPLERSFDFSEMDLNLREPVERNFRRTLKRFLGKTFERVEEHNLNIINCGTIENDPDIDGGIQAYTFTRNGNIVVGSSNSLKLYRNTGELIRNFEGHTGHIWAVSVSGDDKRILASASSDQTIKLWNINTGELLATLFVANDNEWVCWTPQGYYDASAGGEKYIGWHINQSVDRSSKYYPSYVFRERFHKPKLVIRTSELASFEDALADYEKAQGERVERQPVTEMLPPGVIWLSPTEDTTRTSRESIDVETMVTSDIRIEELSIKVNGSVIANKDRLRIISNVGRYGVSIKYNVPLIPGMNRIQIYAENADGSVTSKEKVVIYISINRKMPNLYMVSIGISEYLQDTNLNYADNDARDISQIFAKQQGKLYERVYIKELCNSYATGDSIIAALRWLENNSTERDKVIIFISAHGYNENEYYYILPYDGNPDNLILEGLSSSVFKRVLESIESPILLFLDTCHSGQLGTNYKEFLRELSSERYGIVIMAASTGSEISQERRDWENGAFTEALVDGLEGGMADRMGISEDGIISLRELDLYVAERVRELTNDEQHPTTQKPTSIPYFEIFQCE